MTLRFSSAVALSLSLAGALACSANPSPGSTTTHGDGAGAGSGTPAGGSDPGLNVGSNDPTMMTTRDPNDVRTVPVRQKVCDAAGKCTCLRLAMLGTLTSAAKDTDSQAFIDWLNGKSNGTATLTQVATKPTVDAAFLAQYDILLVANVNKWTLSADEKAAVQKWVSETGGGIINITGFESTATEPAASSQFISFSGLGYAKGTTGDGSAAPASGEAEPVYYQGGTTNVKQCMAWNGGATGTQHTLPLITTPIHFTPQMGQMAKLTLGLDYVGAFIGWPVTAPAGATVLAKDPVNGGNMAVALEYNGAGRIFAFGDEWVIFTNQWEKYGQPNNMQMDQYNPCWVPPTATADGFFLSVQTIYQTKQFWYDAINWVAPPNECNFVVKDPDVVIPK